MLGRPRASARLAETALDVLRRYGVDTTVLVANRIEALFATGDWDEADRLSAAALRAITASYPYMLLMLRADVELGRGRFDAARAHLDAALASLREDRGLGIYDVLLAELALWERRWADADRAVRDGLAGARSPQAAQLRVWFCAKGLRAQAELAALARARRDPGAIRAWLARAGRLVAVARDAAAEAAAVTPTPPAGSPWPRPSTNAPRRRPARVVVGGAAAWERLERPRSPPTAAGARPRPSSPRAPPAARRARRSGTHTP
jgi:hypothetical protein